MLNPEIIELTDKEYFLYPDTFVLTYGEDLVLYGDVKIKDHDGTIHDCYLTSVEYCEYDGTYDVRYKKYKLD